jgi:hypothetical protein
MTPAPNTPAPATDPPRHQTRPTVAVSEPLSVWPHRRAEPALAAVITTYTHRRDRVLLLTPPPHTDHNGTSPRDWDRGLAERLVEPGPDLTRLGRHVSVRTSLPPTHRPGSGSGSGPGSSAAPDRPPARPAPDTPEPADPPTLSGRSDSTADGQASPDPDPTGQTHAGSDAGPVAVAGRPAPVDGVDRPRAKLIITAVAPDAVGWVAQVPWQRLLTRSGVLAVITHGDRIGGRWVDPLPALIGLLTGAGLAWHDRVVLHHGPPAAAGRAHTELLLFTPTAPTRRLHTPPARPDTAARAAGAGDGRDA